MMVGVLLERVVRGRPGGGRGASPKKLCVVWDHQPEAMVVLLLRAQTDAVAQEGGGRAPRG